eukprot:1159867-Pelagomonas_calceolata.AAC.11
MAHTHSATSISMVKLMHTHLHLRAVLLLQTVAQYIGGLLRADTPSTRWERQYARELGLVRVEALKVGVLVENARAAAGVRQECVCARVYVCVRVRVCTDVGERIMPREALEFPKGLAKWQRGSRGFFGLFGASFQSLW